MLEHKYNVGEILQYRLSGEKVIILRRLYHESMNYKVRQKNYDVLEVLEEELEPISLSSASPNVVSV